MTALDELESATGHAAAEPAALWQQIAQHPDDDAPRIVLGDVLLASGDPRGLLSPCSSRAPGIVAVVPSYGSSA